MNATGFTPKQEAKPEAQPFAGDCGILVTVMIAAHDRLVYLKDAVESAVSQDFQSLEVLVVDDGSGEQTREWIAEKEKSNPRIRALFLKHGGVAPARQEGLLTARGKAICILDSDDILLPGAIGTLYEALTKDRAVDLVYTNNLHTFEDGKPHIVKYPRFHSNTKMIHAVFLRPTCPFKHSGTMFWRDTAVSMGGYDIYLPIKVDIGFFLMFLAAHKRLKLVEQPLVRFRVHRNSMSARRFKGIRAYWELADRYMPDSVLTRLSFKTVRAFFEIAKGLVEQTGVLRGQPTNAGLD